MGMAGMDVEETHRKDEEVARVLEDQRLRTMEEMATTNLLETITIIPIKGNIILRKKRDIQKYPVTGNVIGHWIEITIQQLNGVNRIEIIKVVEEVEPLAIVNHRVKERNIQFLGTPLETAEGELIIELEIPVLLIQEKEEEEGQEAGEGVIRRDLSRVELQMASNEFAVSLRHLFMDSVSIISTS